MKIPIYTERLLIGALEKNDHEFILELLNTKGWIEFIGDRYVHSKEQAFVFIEKIKTTPNLNYWVVRLIIDHTAIGIVSFLKRDYLEYFDIGFAFLPQFNGQGYAYEAAKAVLDAVKQDPKHAIILASTLPGNQKSIMLLTKLGFRFAREIEANQEILRVYAHDAAI